MSATPPVQLCARSFGWRVLWPLSLLFAVLWLVATPATRDLVVGVDWPVHEDWYLLYVIQDWAEGKGFPWLSVFAWYPVYRYTVPLLVMVPVVEAADGSMAPIAHLSVVGAVATTVLVLWGVLRLGLAENGKVRGSAMGSGEVEGRGGYGRSGDRDGYSTAELAGWWLLLLGASALTLSPIHFEHLLWGWYLGPRLCLLFQVVGVLVLAGGTERWRTVVGGVCMTLATFSMTWGVFGWIAGAVVIGLRPGVLSGGWRGLVRGLGVWSGVAIGVVLVFLYLPTGQPEEWARLGGPYRFPGVGAVVGFGLGYLGAPLAVSVLGFHHPLVVGMSVVLGLVFVGLGGWVVWSAWMGARAGRWDRAGVACAALVAVVTLTAFLTGAGRSTALQQVLTSRYFFISGTGWIVLGAWWLTRAGGTGRQLGGWLVVPVAALALVAAVGTVVNRDAARLRVGWILESRAAFLRGDSGPVTRRAAPDVKTARLVAERGRKLGWPMFTGRLGAAE